MRRRQPVAVRCSAVMVLALSTALLVASTTSVSGDPVVVFINDEGVRVVPQRHRPVHLDHATGASRLGDAFNPRSRVVPAQVNTLQPFDPTNVAPPTAGGAPAGGTSLLRLRFASRKPDIRSNVTQSPLEAAAGTSEEAISDVAASTTSVDQTAPSVTSAGPDSAELRQAAAKAIEPVATPSLLSTPSVDVVTTGQIQMLGASETANILQESTSVQTVDVQRRSPVDFDPRIRGFHVGQVSTTSAGTAWIPVRQDLDSLLSKIDPSLIEDVIVIPGPYGLRYGPAFGYVDVVPSLTPRYEQGAEFHSRLGITSRTNGGNLYGRETVYGGGSDWGAIFHYGSRTGSDYESGNGTLVPASYQAQNFLGQLGYDTSAHSTWEFRYQRLDQTDTEYAGQFFDIDFLITDSYSLGYVNRDGCAKWSSLQLDGWYHSTRYVGDTRNFSKRRFHVIDRVENALGTSFLGETNGGLTSSGVRGRVEFGEDDETQLAVGVDFQYTKQLITEQYRFPGSPDDPFATKLPVSRSFDTGFYSELSMPWTPDWSTSIAARIDQVHMSADEAELRDNSSLPGGPAALSQNDTLYAWNVLNDLQLTNRLTSRIGFGHAQRAPTLVDRFADGLFLGIIQSGFSRVIGDPNLDKERLYQADASLQGNYDDWGFRLGGFHSWVLDYVTYTGNVINDPLGARLLRTINTDLATLTGGELYVERSLNDRVTLFGATQYIDGRDRQIDAPLPGISPFEGRWGVRLVDRNAGERWGLEFSSRVVNGQDRLGALRLGTTTVVDVIPLELRTPGFTTYQIRGYWQITDSLHIVAGIDNLTDQQYLQHLNLRLPDQGAFRNTSVFDPGISPYATIEWTY